MNKRILMFVVAFSLLISAFGGAMSASAYTQQDLLEEFATIPASHWVYADIEKLSATMPLTEEQCNQLWPLLQEVKALLPTDNGPSVYHGSNHDNTGRAYSAEVVARVLDLIREACKITGCTFVKSLVPEQTHDIDIVFKLYDSTGKLIFEYDGDLVKKTGAEQENALQASEIGMLVAGVSFIALSAALAVVLAKKKKASFATVA